MREPHGARPTMACARVHAMRKEELAGGVSREEADDVAGGDGSN